MNAHILLVDLGTGAAKVQCVNADGVEIGSTFGGYEVAAEAAAAGPRRPRTDGRAAEDHAGAGTDGRAGSSSSAGSTSDSEPVPRDEADPEVWFAALARAVGDLGRSVSLDTLQYIVLTGQMQDLITVANGRSIGRAILYYGQRPSTAFDNWKEAHGEDAIIDQVCNLPDASQFPAKMLHLEATEPDRLEATQSLLCGAHDYIAYRLTGVAATDPTTASTTGLFSPQSGTWAQGIIESLPRWAGRLPEIHRGNEIDGVVRAEVAQELGLPGNVQVVHGVGDVGSSILAMEAEGFSRSLYLGTSGWIQEVGSTDEPGDPHHGVFTLRHPIRDRLIRVAPMLTAAGAFDWFVRDIIADKSGDADRLFQSLGTATAAMGPKDTPVLFLPYLVGERSPFHDPDATGLFLGLRRDTDRRRLFRAVEEGVAMAIRSVFEGLIGSTPESERDQPHFGNDQVTAERTEAIQLTGGGASLVGFPALVAEVLRAPVAVTRDARFSGTRALVGLVSHNATADAATDAVAVEDASVEDGAVEDAAPEAAAADVGSSGPGENYEVYEPRFNEDVYADKYRLFRDAYSRNRELMKALRAIH